MTARIDRANWERHWKRVVRVTRERIADEKKKVDKGVKLIV